MRIRENIKRLRQERGLSLEKLAARCSPPTSRQQIDRLEKGERPLTVQWIERIAVALGVDPAEVVAGERGEFILAPQVANVVARTVGRIALKGGEPDPVIVKVLAQLLTEMIDMFAAHPATRTDPQAARAVLELLARQSGS
jgi:transcriptional regulator with XRE-family HTH domain